MRREQAAAALTSETASAMVSDHARIRTPSQTPFGRVLVVEDEPSLAENLREIIELFGYQTVALPSAEAAWTEIESGPVGFIVTDHRLPGMSGASFIVRLRSAGRMIPCVMTTAWITDAEAETVAESGLAEVLPKPIDLGRLISQIHRTLRPEAH